MKDVNELDRIVQRIWYFKDKNEFRRAVDQLQRLVKAELETAFDEVESLAEQNTPGTIGVYRNALHQTRIKLGIERKIGSSSCASGRCGPR